MTFPTVLHGREIWFLTYATGVWKQGAYKAIWAKREEVREGCIQLKMRGLIIYVPRQSLLRWSGNMRWAVHVVSTGEKINAHRVWWKYQKKLPGRPKSRLVDNIKTNLTQCLGRGLDSRGSRDKWRDDKTSGSINCGQFLDCPRDC